MSNKFHLKNISFLTKYILFRTKCTYLFAKKPISSEDCSLKKGEGRDHLPVGWNECKTRQIRFSWTYCLQPTMDKCDWLIGLSPLRIWTGDSGFQFLVFSSFKHLLSGFATNRLPSRKIIEYLVKFYNFENSPFIYFVVFSFQNENVKPRMLKYF